MPFARCTWAPDRGSAEVDRGWIAMSRFRQMLDFRFTGLLCRHVIFASLARGLASAARLQVRTLVATARLMFSRILRRAARPFFFLMLRGPR